MLQWILNLLRRLFGRRPASRLTINSVLWGCPRSRFYYKIQFLPGGYEMPLTSPAGDTSARFSPVPRDTAGNVAPLAGPLVGTVVDGDASVHVDSAGSVLVVSNTPGRVLVNLQATPVGGGASFGTHFDFDFLPTVPPAPVAVSLSLDESSIVWGNEKIPVDPPAPSA